jgi:hypothetical protein
MNHQLDFRTVLDEHARRIGRAERYRLVRDTVEVTAGSRDRPRRLVRTRTGIVRSHLQLWRRRRRTETTIVAVPRPAGDS